MLLRPEPTAGIVRAYVQHGLQTWPQPVKVFEIGPMFRYDRPQAGRYRQFWQFDVEAIRDPGPAVDAEIIELGTRLYRDAGLSGVQVLLNSIGDAACRPAYIEELTDYYRDRASALPPTERDRLDRNVLRLLDSKDPVMAAINAGAPRITDRLCDACATHFASVRAHLDALSLAYRIEPGLVRGLDYYTRTAFEFYVEGRGPARPSAAVVATTGSSSCSVAGRRRASASASGSIDYSSHSMSRATRRSPPGSAHRRPSSSGRIRQRRWNGCASQRSSARRGSPRGPSSASGSSASS